MCNNSVNNCGCEPVCGCTQPCNCQPTCACAPTPCEEGCLTDTKTDCVFLSEDLDICTEILPKGSTVTAAFNKLGNAVCNGVTVTVQDMKVKVDPNDTTSGYLFDKITTCNNITKTVTNINGNETLQLCAKIDTVTGGNIITTGPDGLYVPTPNPTGYNLTPLFSSTVGLTVNPIVGGQSIKADVKISPNAGNLLVDNGGLYVSLPTIPNATTVSATNSNAITTTSTLAGNNYNIHSTLKIDPSSTAPISITANGLKVDCCVPITPANTPISVVIGSTSCMAMTATGIDNHVLTPSVVVSPSAGNALVATTTGLYVAAPGSASATTIVDTPTVDATLINPTTYQLDVKKSTDSCNALVLGSDNALYVNGVEEPNSLGFVVDGSDVYFEFQGPSTNNTDYLVEIQGTTGSPTLWIPASFDSISGPVLRYSVSGTNVTATIRARVKFLCGSNESIWVGLTYEPPFTLISENGTINVTPSTSGVNNEWSVDVADLSCVNDFTCTPSIVYIGGNYFCKIIRVANSVNSDVYTVKVHSPSLGDMFGGATITDEVITLIPMSEYVAGETYDVVVTRHCTYGVSGSTAVTIPITNLPALQNCATGWINMPNANLSSGILFLSPYTISNLTNDYKLKYLVNEDGSLELNGVVKLTLSAPIIGGSDTGWKDLIDIANIPCLTNSSTKEFYPLVSIQNDFDYDADINSPGGFLYLGGVFVRRFGNKLQFRIPNTVSTNTTCYLVLSGLKFK